jgi:hypothetical protein
MEFHDLNQLALQDAKREKEVAANYMPVPVPLYVLNTSKQQSNGYVICARDDPSGARVRCLVPGFWDLTPDDAGAARVVIWALPMNGKAEGSQYIALWPSWNGQDESRMPRDNGLKVSPVTALLVSTTLSALYEVVEVNTSIGGVSLTLPLLASMRGKHFYIKKTSGDGNSMTIDGNGAETIDGSGTKSKTSQYGYWHIVGGTSMWLIVAEG